MGHLNIPIQQEKIYYNTLGIYIIEFNIYKSLKLINVASHQLAEENQQLDDMVIKEEEVDIKTRNDREVIVIQIIKIIMQDHSRNSSHIMSDNLKSIYLKRCIIASKFIMDSEIYTLFIYLQDSFAKELIIQLKIILEKITQVDFDITLLIENCDRIQYVYITYLIDSVNIIKEKDKDHHGRILDILIEEHNRGHLLGVYHLKKDLIKFDIVLDILDIHGILPRGGISPQSTSSQTSLKNTICWTSAASRTQPSLRYISHQP